MPGVNARQDSSGQPLSGQSAYRALVALRTQTLAAEAGAMRLNAGMQIAAEIRLGDQTVLEYLLSPVRKAFHEAGRER